MTSLIDFADPGMVILPTHRLVRGVSRAVLAGLPSQLAAFFEIGKIALTDPALWQKVDVFLTGMAPETRNTSLAVYGLDSENILILTLRDQKKANQLMPAFHGDLYRKLDVSLVDHIIWRSWSVIIKTKKILSWLMITIGRTALTGSRMGNIR